jgi:hypothetical protein
VYVNRGSGAAPRYMHPADTLPGRVPVFPREQYKYAGIGGMSESFSRLWLPTVRWEDCPEELGHYREQPEPRARLISREVGPEVPRCA